MYFYIDESGHTGPNLFDPDQPMLYYGVLSSKVNVDLLAADRLQGLRKRCGVQRLHAADMGSGGLVEIITDLCQLQQQLDLRFDLYRVAKPDHAIISFFDQVFDQGLNPAVTWTGYWTPLRYILLLKLATLFDEDLARCAWDARLETNDVKSNEGLVQVCAQLRALVHKLPDKRSRQLITDTLEWTEKNPNKICYNTKTKKDRLAVMPNIIGFQSVILGIAARLRKTKRNASCIVVDQQSQFNRSQKTLADYYASVRSIQFENGPGLPEISFKGVPAIPIEFSSGLVSPGLELSDIYLWVFKRTMEGKDLAPELSLLINSQLHRGRTDEISLKALEQRWDGWFRDLPEPTEQQMENAREIIAVDEARRLHAIGKGT